MQIKTFKTEDLIEYARNPRKNDDVIDKMVSCIKEFGFKIPIVAKSDGSVVDGHLRLKAARKLDMKEVPVVIADDLTDAQIKAFRLVANQSASWADWNDDLLKLELEDLKNLNFDLELTGFDLAEIESFLNKNRQITEDAFEDDGFLNDELPPTSKLGDLWILDKHRLLCGDSTNEKHRQRLLGSEKIDLVFTDPPYGIGADKMNMGSSYKKFPNSNWDNKRPDISFLLELAEKICIWGGNYFSDVLPPTNDWLCWYKKNNGLSFSEFELAWTNFGKNCRHLSHHWGSEKKQHITMKPNAVCVWGIDMAGDNVRSVFDSFGGSGSTLIACEQTNRRCNMMELDPKYVDIIIRRWQKLTGKSAILESTEQSFDEVSSCR